MRQRILLRTMLFCLTLLAFCGLARADGIDSLDGVTFTLVQANPSGNPGDKLTWMYDVTNDSGYQIAGLYVNAGLFIGGTPNAGAFDDFGPSGIINNDSSLEGVLFSFASDPTVANSVNTGQFDLGILILDPNGDQIDLYQTYSATISPATPVPEPGALPLLAVGLACVVLARRFR